MKVGRTMRMLTLVIAAAMLVTIALAAAPKAPSAFGPVRITAAHAAEAAASGEKKEIPHVVGHPSQSQLVDLRRAWDTIAGYDLLLVSILGMVAIVGVIGFGAFKQMKV